MIEAITTLTLIGLILGTLLGIASRYLKVEGNHLAEEIDAMLPGSQCGQCGFPGCTPAAEAIACGEAEITICPPGGLALAEALAAKLGVELDASAVEERLPTVAVINEAVCIGCTRCFKQCPTDALVGASKQLHAVIDEACTGCGKCVDSCPTEGIVMREIKPTLKSWQWPNPADVNRREEVKG